MAKIGSGAVSLLLALGWLLLALFSNSSGQDPWLLTKVPLLIFFGLEVPRIVILGIALLAVGGGGKLFLDGVLELTSISDFKSKLLSGLDSKKILELDLEATAWPQESWKKAAQASLRGESYENTIAELQLQLNLELSDAIIAYRLATEHLVQRIQLLITAAQAVGKTLPTPRPTFPCVRITESQKRTLADRMLKVDLSTTGNQTPLLTAGDLVVGLNGQLITHAEQLDALAAATPEQQREIQVLRRVKTQNANPITGQLEEQAWQAMKFPIAPGPIQAQYQTDNSPLI